jgi:formylglycine-generating enzyme required for sulfatase activity
MTCYQQILCIRYRTYWNTLGHSIFLSLMVGCAISESSKDTPTKESTESQTLEITEELQKSSIDIPLQTKALESTDDMVHIGQGMVELGPRHIEAVQGYAMPTNVSGVTPNLGKGNDQRAAGGPPLPGTPQNALHPNIPNTQQPNSPNQGNRNFPQHQPQFALDPQLSGTAQGVGHMRPGSGVPSAPPNMPGTQAKLVGEEKPWTANPSNQMKSKFVIVSDFWIDKTEVTRIEYQKFLQATGYRPPFISEEWAKDGWNWNGTEYPADTGDHPVVLISWYDATEYCVWKGKRLPTEAEWQLAALGDARLGNIYPWGKTYNHDALNHGQIESPNFDDSDGYLHTSPAGAFPTGNTATGLQDMFGNAWEFTSDARRATWEFYKNVEGDTPTDSYAPTPSLYVAVRGGAYFFDLRPNPGGERNEFLTEVRRKTAGFRCAK